MSRTKAKLLGLQEDNTLKVEFEDSDMTAVWQIVVWEPPTLSQAPANQSSRRHLLSNGRVNTFPQQRS
jgi:hypothetical protein